MYNLFAVVFYQTFSFYFPLQNYDNLHFFSILIYVDCEVITKFNAYF